MDWLLAGASRADARRLRTLLDSLPARGIHVEALADALRAAYWAAQRAAIPGVVAGHRRALTRQQRALARLDEAVTAVLNLAEPVAAELAGHLHVARALARSTAARLVPPGAARPGRPSGWRDDAVRDLTALGLRHREARPLLVAVGRLAASRRIAPGAVPYLRVASRLPAADRERVLGKLLPLVRKPSGSGLFPDTAAAHPPRMKEDA
jgi:hypothetical protein